MKQTFEVKTSFIRLMKWVPGVFYEPVGRDGEHLNTVLVVHSDEDYLDAPTGPQLAKRGFRVKNIILMGHSGGATLMTAYQAIAENGPQVYLKKFCPPRRYPAATR